MLSKQFEESKSVEYLIEVQFILCCQVTPEELARARIYVEQAIWRVKERGIFDRSSVYFVGSVKQI